jgi:G:T-mismatch repair DNA endonuclease (very short patch repair protein)
MNVQEREHWDYEAGVASEFQNSFAMSKMTTTVKREDARIAQLRREGHYVAVSECEVCCRFTDALIGITRTVIGTARTRQEALVLCGGEESAEAYVADPV